MTLWRDSPPTHIWGNRPLHPIVAQLCGRPPPVRAKNAWITSWPRNITMFYGIVLSGPIISSQHVNLKGIERNTRLGEPKNALTTSWRRNVTIFVHDIKRPYSIYLPCQFEGDRMKNTPRRAEKRVFWQWWRHYVMTSWRNFLLPWCFMFTIELCTILAHKTKMGTHS